MNGWTSSTGNLNRRIDICSVVSTLSESGSVTESYPVILSTWADVRELRGKEQFAQGQDVAHMEATFLIRYREDVALNKSMVIKYGGKTWEISAIAEIGNKERFEICARIRRDTQ